MVTFALGKTIAVHRVEEGMKARAVNMRAEGFDVRVDRKSDWGNPFAIGKDGDREAVIRKYRSHLVRHRDLLQRLWDGELRGKRLGCWCAPEKCHSDDLAFLSHASRAEWVMWISAVYATEE